MVNASTPQVKGSGTGGNTRTANSATMASNAFTMSIMSASLMLDGTTFPSVEDIEPIPCDEGAEGSYPEPNNAIRFPVQEDRTIMLDSELRVQMQPGSGHHAGDGNTTVHTAPP